jgi:hypothetical protein
MPPKNEDELEFISVGADTDEGSMSGQTYGASGAAAGGGGYGNVIGSWLLNQSKHPGAVFFHFLFKGLAIFIYVFGSWITTSFIFTFVICVVLLAFDFWTVKNVSGRLLVGLRWWSYVREDGSNEWIFESLEDMAEITAFDSRMFWGGLYAAPVAWALLLLIGLLRLKFEYMPIVIAALVLSGANIMGYMKCSSSAKAKMQSMMEAGIKQGGAMGALAENSALRSWVFSSLLAVTSKGAAPAPTQNQEPVRM